VCKKSIAVSFTAHGDTNLNKLTNMKTHKKEISSITLAEPPDAGAYAERGGNGRDDGGYQPNPKVPFLTGSTHVFFHFFRKTGENQQNR
jgi:hypothetical protein